MVHACEFGAEVHLW